MSQDRYYLDFAGRIEQLLKSGSVYWVSLGALGGYMSQDRYYLDFAGRIEQLLKSGSILFGFRWAR